MENAASFSEKARRFLARNGDAVLCVSPLVRMEVLIKPLHESATMLVADYEEFLAAQNWLFINDSTFNMAEQMRAFFIQMWQENPQMVAGAGRRIQEIMSPLAVPPAPTFGATTEKGA